MRAALFCVLAAGACVMPTTGTGTGDDDGTSGGGGGGATFAYRATLLVDSTELVSFTVNGQPAEAGDVVQGTFVDFGSAEHASMPVIAMTTGGTETFALVPTACGNGPICTDPTLPGCATLTVESEDWAFHDSTLAGSGDALVAFGPDEGQCTFSDGQQASWAN